MADTSFANVHMTGPPAQGKRGCRGPAWWSLRGIRGVLGLSPGHAFCSGNRVCCCCCWAGQLSGCTQKAAFQKQTGPVEPDSSVLTQRCCLECPGLNGPGWPGSGPQGSPLWPPTHPPLLVSCLALEAPRGSAGVKWMSLPALPTSTTQSP